MGSVKDRYGRRRDRATNAWAASGDGQPVRVHRAERRESGGTAERSDRSSGASATATRARAAVAGLPVSKSSPSQDPPAPVSASQAAESPAPVVTSPVIASPIAASPIVASTVPAAEPEPTSETYSAPEVQPAAAVSSAQGVIQEVRTEKVDAAPLPVERSTPPATETAPAVDPQQDVFSKLALISSIKQRRAVTMRPDGTGPAETKWRPRRRHQDKAYGATAATRNAAPMPQSKQPPEAALLAVPVPFAAAPTVTAGSTPAAPAAVPMDVRSPEKPSLPAKKVWSNSSGHHAATNPKHRPQHPCSHSRRQARLMSQPRLLEPAHQRMARRAS